MSTATLPLLVRSVDNVHTEVNRRTGIVRAIVSDDSNDRFKTVFDPEGADWSGWENGGRVVLYEHGHGTRGMLPVGNVEEGPEVTTFRGRRSIVTGTRFWDSDEFSRQIGEVYRSMAMRSWSINAIALDQSPPSPAERRARSDWAECHTVYRRWELVELSVVSCAGNSNATTLEVLRSGAGIAPISRELTASDQEAIDRRFKAEVNGVIARAVREAKALGDLDGLTNAELAALVKRLQLQIHASTLQSVRDRQEDWKRKKEEYSRIGQEFRSGYSRRSTCRNCGSPLDSFLAGCRFCRG